MPFTREEEEDPDSILRRSYLYFPLDQDQENLICQQRKGGKTSPSVNRGLYSGVDTGMVDGSRKAVSSLPSAFPDLLHSFVHEEVIEVFPTVVVQRRRNLQCEKKRLTAEEEEEKKKNREEKFHDGNPREAFSMSARNRDSARENRHGGGGMERERERKEERGSRSAAIFSLDETDACIGSENAGEDYAFPNFVLEGTVKRLDEFPSFDRVDFTVRTR